ncbi:ImmA/IrrE family metallo-endopeptidase [Paracoccus sediminilitoris]|uniref:ImmA/IrrE family metallo-endopeptidase n=1 Tax=Paracoccus sediminilitoris TaxID=2202419 RepID=UPI000DB93154|nr:ImmA/IrrE family metallo-endopeptidase [Paracoccus sediminilitoris]
MPVLTTRTKTLPTKEAIRLTNLWQKYGPNTYPLDIAELIDGAFRDSGFDGQLTTKRGCFDSFEGCLVRTKDSQNWTILLNDMVENKRRQRFTHAHELGHFMCHRGLRDRFEDSDASLNDFRDNIESEANLFASWLLMPANIIRDEFSGSRWDAATLCQVGCRFECSLQASALRLVSLSSKPIAFVVSRDGIILWACKSASAPYMAAYCFGDELPETSLALVAHREGSGSLEAEDSGDAWNNFFHAKESQYFDTSGRGYQYTCIEF